MVLRARGSIPWLFIYGAIKRSSEIKGDRALFTPPFITPIMPDEPTLRASFLAGLFVLAFLVVSWYLKGDPLVGHERILCPA
jgi:hypothetical protein